MQVAAAGRVVVMWCVEVAAVFYLLMCAQRKRKDCDACGCVCEEHCTQPSTRQRSRTAQPPTRRPTTRLVLVANRRSSKMSINGTHKPDVKQRRHLFTHWCADDRVIVWRWFGSSSCGVAIVLLAQCRSFCGHVYVEEMRCRRASFAFVGEGDTPIFPRKSPTPPASLSCLLVWLVEGLLHSVELNCICIALCAHRIHQPTLLNDSIIIFALLSCSLGRFAGILSCMIVQEMKHQSAVKVNLVHERTHMNVMDAHGQ
mmetsp:Transcript_12814/g.35382  ORF Transcript_12814/g.35382 Transcript_12814/m.35382 type:complete len:257 (-) Transcript_12814:968-1738(-)